MPAAIPRTHWVNEQRSWTGKPKSSLVSSYAYETVDACCPTASLYKLPLLFCLYEKWLLAADDKVSTELKKQISSARLAKKLTQAQLANVS